MGIVLPVLTNEKQSLPRLLISAVVFRLTGTKKEAQMAKVAAGYDLLREKLMENKIACIPNYLKRLWGFQFK